MIFDRSCVILALCRCAETSGAGSPCCAEVAVRSVTAQLMRRDERPFGITEGGRKEGGRERETHLLENARIVHPIAVSWSAAHVSREYICALFDVRV